MYIDTHAHLYLNQFEEDRSEMVNLINSVKVQHVYLPNIDCSTIESMMNLEKDNPKLFSSMMGLHPCSVKENFKEELSSMERWLEERSFKSIGEIGIDLYWDKTFKSEQEQAFRTQIEWAKNLNIPFVIHSRDSLDITIDIVSEMQNGDLKGIFHCFNGSIEQAKKIKDVGFLMGIGGVVTFKNAGVDKTVAQCDLSDLVLETDAPYLAPVPHRGKRNQSDYIPLIADKLSDIFEININEVARITTQNALNLFENN